MKKGDTLKNGATVLEATEQTDGSMVVLCLWPKATNDEYVTWYANPEIGCCYWGHYYDSLVNAVEDYKARGGVA